jgi:hypothetical protein
MALVGLALFFFTTACGGGGHHSAGAPLATPPPAGPDGGADDGGGGGSGGGPPGPGEFLFGGAGDQRGTGIAVLAPSGGAPGAIYVSAESGDGTRGIALRLDLPLAGGPPAWVAGWPPAGGSDEGFAAVAARGGRAWFAGRSTSLTTDETGEKEAKTILFDYPASGDATTPTWAASAPPRASCDGSVGATSFFCYGGLEALAGLTTALEDGALRIYAAGAGEPCGGTGCLVAKYDELGDVLAAATDAFAGLSFEECTAGTGGSEARGIAVDGGGHVVAAGSVIAPGDTERAPAIWKYDASLAPILRIVDTTLPGGQGGAFAAVTAIGSDIVAAGYVSGSGYLAERFDAEGNPVWRTIAADPRPGRLLGLVTVGARLFAAGFTESGGLGGKDGVILEIDPASGAILSTTLYGGAEDDLFSGCATDGTDVYAVGETRSYAASGNRAGEDDIWVVRHVVPPPPPPGPDQPGVPDPPSDPDDPQAPGSGPWRGVLLPPVDPAGTSVFTQGSTVPVKLRVCDPSGASIGTAGLVRDFRLVRVVAGSETYMLDEPAPSTTPFTEFRWDPAGGHWIFNLDTGPLSAGCTYGFRVTLADLSCVEFQLGLR